MVPIQNCKICSMDGKDDCDHAILVDFQLGNVGGPYADLNYLLGTSAFPADLKDHLNSWLRTYHQAFIKTMVIFGYPESIYPFAQLKKDFQRGRYFGIFICLFQAGVSTTQVLLIYIWKK